MVNAYLSNNYVLSLCSAILLASVALAQPTSTESLADETIRLQPLFVQSRGKVGVHADLTRLSAEQGERGAKVVISVSAQQKQFGAASFDAPPKTPFYAYFDLPESLHEQLLEFSCRVLDAQGGNVLEQTLSYQLPEAAPWLGRYHVPPDFVPSPWTPLYRNVDGVIHCWGRRYVFGDSVLPQQIIANGVNVLDGPVTFDVLTADGAVKWDDQPVNLEQVNGAKIIMTRRGQAGALDVLIRTTMEFDGFVYVEAELTPRGRVELDDVRMLIPIRREVGKFFHVDGGWGEKRFGAVSQRENYPATLDERNYYWLGNDDVGLCWMTEVLAQWPRNSESPGQTRVGFRETATGYEGYFQPWAQRQPLDKPLKLNFALQATPVRPPHAQPVRVIQSYDTPVEKLKYPVSSNKRPVIMSALAGKFNYPPYEQDAEMVRQRIADYAKNGFVFLIYQYISEQIAIDEFQNYWGDWATSIPFRTGPSARASDWADCCLNSSWSDYYLHIVDTMMTEYGADGVYLDGTMQERLCQRGDIHGPKCDNTWPLLVSREHLKKLRYVLQRNKGAESYLWGHTSDLKIAPLIGFMDVLYEGENYGYPISYNDITSDVLRAQFGAQWGPATVWLPQLTKKKLQEHVLNGPQFLGLSALHGIECTTAFLSDADKDNLLYPMWKVLDEFPDTEAQFLPYFKQKLIVEASGHPVSVYVSKSRDRLLLVLANRGDDAVLYQMQLQPEQHYGPGRISAIQDNMRNEIVAFDGNDINLTLGGGEFRLLEVTLK